MWRQVLNKVKASAMMNLLMCDYVCGFLAVLGQYLLVFISYVNFFKLQVIIFLVISNVQDSGVVFHIIQVPGVCVNTGFAIWFLCSGLCE